MRDDAFERTGGLPDGVAVEVKAIAEGVRIVDRDLPGRTRGIESGIGADQVGGLCQRHAVGGGLQFALDRINHAQVDGKAHQAKHDRYKDRDDLNGNCATLRMFTAGPHDLGLPRTRAWRPACRPSSFSRPSWIAALLSCSALSVGTRWLFPAASPRRPGAGEG